MFNEGYVKIPIARYEELRDIEKAVENEEFVKQIELKDFTKITETFTVKDEQRSGFFPVMKNKIAIEIDLQELQKQVIKEYEGNIKNYDYIEVVEVTIKNGEEYNTEVLESNE